MRLFVLCLYFLFLVFSLRVSGLHGPIIRGISSCCFYATIWFMQCFVDRLRASADWFVLVTSVTRIEDARNEKPEVHQEHLTVFRVSGSTHPSSSRLGRVCWLLASNQSAESLWHTPDAVCTVLDSRWWTERPSETCRVLLQNKINLRNCCI